MDNRRQFIKKTAVTATAMSVLADTSAWAIGTDNYVTNRPAPGDRTFVSKAVE